MRLTRAKLKELNDSRSWLHRVGDATSQWINATAFNGDPNESVSGRSYRQGWRAKWWIDGLLGSDHCRTAWLLDVYRAELLVIEHGASLKDSD